MPSLPPPGATTAPETVGRTLLVLHLLLSPLVFCRSSLDVFEYNKVALLLLTALVLAGLGAATALGRLGRLAAGAKRAVRLGRDPIAVGFVLYLASAILSTVGSLSPRTSWYGAEESFSGLPTVLGYTVLFFATRACFRTAAQARGLLAAVVIASGITAGYALVQVVGADPIPWHRVSTYGDYVRPFSTLGHPNFLGAYLAMALPIVVVGAERAARSGRRLRALILAAVAVLATGILILTLSRGAWLALLAVGAVLLGLRWRGLPGRRLRIGAALAAGTVVVATVGLILLGGPGLRSSLIDRGRHLTEATNRAFVWRTSLEIFCEHPLCGSGLDTFQLAFAAKRPVGFWLIEWNATPTKAHCEPLHVLATQGLSGGLALLVLTAGLLRAGGRAVRQGSPQQRALVAAACAGIVGFYVQNLFSFTVAGCGTLFVTLAALLSRWAETGDASIVPTEPVEPDRIRPAVRLGQALLGAGVAGLAFVGVIRPYLADRQCARGVDLTNEDAVRAVGHLEQAVALDPGREIHWTKLGGAAQAAAQSTGDARAQEHFLSLARDAYQRSTDLVPANAYNHANLGWLRGQLARRQLAPPDQALAEYDTALTLDRNNACFYRDACEVALEVGALTRARDYAVRGLALYPRYGPLRALLGCVALLEGRPEEAVCLHEEAFRSDWYGDERCLALTEGTMAVSLLRLHRYSEALAYSQRATETGLRSVQNRLCRATALEGLHRREEAVAEYRAILDLRPGLPAAQAALARLGVRLPETRPALPH